MAPAAANILGIFRYIKFMTVIMTLFLLFMHTKII